MYSSLSPQISWIVHANGEIWKHKDNEESCPPEVVAIIQPDHFKWHTFRMHTHYWLWLRIKNAEECLKSQISCWCQSPDARRGGSILGFLKDIHLTWSRDLYFSFSFFICENRRNLYLCLGSSSHYRPQNQK